MCPTAGGLKGFRQNGRRKKPSYQNRIEYSYNFNKPHEKGKDLSANVIY